MNDRVDRVGAAAGVLYPILVLAGLALASSPDLGASTEEIGRFLRDVNVIRFVGGSYVVVLAMLCLLVFAGRLHSQLREGERADSWLANAALAGATAAAVAHLVGTVAAGPAILRFDGSDLGAAALFVRLGPLIAWIGEASAALLYGAAGLEILRRHQLPTWLGWAGCAIALALWGTVPLAATGIPHIPATLGSVWILATGLAMMRQTREAIPAPSRSLPDDPQSAQATSSSPAGI